LRARAELILRSCDNAVADYIELDGETADSTSNAPGVRGNVIKHNRLVDSSSMIKFTSEEVNNDVESNGMWPRRLMLVP
jgi:hypothetical protein